MALFHVRTEAGEPSEKQKMALLTLNLLALGFGTLIWDFSASKSVRGKPLLFRSCFLWCSFVIAAGAGQILAGELEAG